MNPLSATQDRGVSPVVSHAAALGIMAIVVAGLIVAANGVYTDEQSHANHNQLSIIGNRLADELSRASRLAQDGGNVSITTHHQQEVGGESYLVSLRTGSACDTDTLSVDTCLELRLVRSGTTVMVPVNNVTPVHLSTQSGGSFTVSAEATGGSPPQLDPAVNLERTIGIGKSINPYGSGTSVNLTNRNPIAGFTFTPGQPSVDSVIHFENDTEDLDGVIDTYEWDLDGDGTVDRTGREFDYSYADPGRYTVTLTVTDDDGDKDSVSKIISVGGLVYEETTDEDLDLTGDAGAKEESLRFKIKNKHEDSITIEEFLVDPKDDTIDQLTFSGDEIFIDGSSDDHTEDDPRTIANGGYIHILDEEGDNDETVLSANTAGWVRLRGFHDGSDEVDMAGKDVFIAIRYEVDGEHYTTQFTLGTTPLNQAPDVEFTSSCTDKTCTFDGTGSTDPDGGSVSYAWSFGDGATATGGSPGHTYANNGSFDVSLTVTDDEGVSSILTKSVRVGAPQRWFNTDWGKRKPITILHDQVAGDLTGFPVLVSITDADLAAKAQDDGDDIVFTEADGTTKLSHEIESFDGSTGELVAWVNVSTVSDSSNTTIYMYYANSGAPNQEDIPGVWGPDYTGVWHLDESPGDGVAGFEDSTSNDNTGTARDFSGWWSTTDAAGQIAGGVEADGNDAYIETDDELTSLRSTSTLSAWVRFEWWESGDDELEDAWGIAGWSECVDWDPGWFDNDCDGFDSDSIHWGWTDQSLDIGLNVGDENTAKGLTNLDDDEWHYVTLTRDATSGDLQVYIDGTLEQASSGPSGTVSEPFSNIGRIVNAGASDDEYFSGRLDETRISRTVRSPDWIQTAYANQDDPGSFYDVGDEQALYQESSGQVVMEAENPMAVQPGNDNDVGPSNGDDMSGVTWSTVSDTDASGDTALVASPAAGDRSADDTENGERLDYYVDFSNSGDFYIWVRMKCPSNSDDGVHIGLNGTPMTYGADGLDADATKQCHEASGWVWVSHVGGSQLQITVPSTGPHTLNVWMVDDGASIDKVVLKTSNSPPTGEGPAESSTS